MTLRPATSKQPRVYGVDVDDTLAIGPHPGPVRIEDLEHLMNQGNIIGIIGNHRIVFAYWDRWWRTIAFFGGFPPPTKTAFMQEIKYSIQLGNPYIKDFCMIGNAAGNPNVSFQSNDDGYARLAGWRFIPEISFSQGVR